MLFIFPLVCIEKNNSRPSPIIRSRLRVCRQAICFVRIYEPTSALGIRQVKFEAVQGTETWDWFLRRRGNKSRLPFARCGRISNPASQSQAAAAHTPLASLVRWFALVWLRAWTRWLHFDVTTHSGKAPNSNLVCGMQLVGWNVV